MSWRRLGVRVRITLGSLAIAVAFFAVVAVVVREQLDHVLDASTLDLVRRGASTAAIEESRSTEEAVVHGISATLVVAMVVLIVGFALSSWVLVGFALRPVGRMRATADLLRRGRTAELLPVSPARDELSALASTLNGLIADLRESAERERQLVADASHELRTPLAALRTRLELSERVRGDPDALHADIVDARRSVDRLQELTDGLLLLSRIDAGASTGSADAAALRAELADAVDRARMLARARDLAIEFQVPSASPPAPGATPARYAVSPADLGRILDNLLGNAVRATPDGGAIVATLREDPDGLRVAVTDDGPGTPESFLAVATDRFTRPDAARSGRGSGAGLGLAIVDGLTRAAGGTLLLRNVRPHGLAAEIHLPPTAHREDHP
ncbi:signal transduction histidine kinase [Clavibacter michiganensis]|nr:signal transduction histidine kinase [Clavibacter michiganensis]